MQTCTRAPVVAIAERFTVSTIVWIDDTYARVVRGDYDPALKIRKLESTLDQR